MNKELTVQEIRSKIVTLPGRPPAMSDRDLAENYGTETKKLNQAVKKNPDRFPEDFCFQLTENEMEILRPQTVTAISPMSRTRAHALTGKHDSLKMTPAVFYTGMKHFFLTSK